MRIALWLGVLVIGLSARASQLGGTTTTRFLPPGTRCDHDVDTGVDATPQSPPLDIDDPGTPGCDKWEVNVLAMSNATPHDNDQSLPLFDINYGIGNNIELTYMLPVAYHSDSDSSATGLGNTNVGVKYMFYEDDDDDIQLSIYPQFQMSAGSQAVDEQLADPGTITEIPILFSKKLGDTEHGDIMLTLNLAYNIVSGRSDLSDYVWAAAGLGVPASRHIAIMGELSTEQGLQTIEGTRDQLIKANIGAMATVNKWLLLYGALGRSVLSSDGLNHDYVVTGIQILTDSPLTIF